MRIFALAMFIGAVTAASPVAGQAPSFEAASIKPNTSGDLRVRGGTRGRAYNAVNMALRRIIATAYDLQLEEFRLVGDLPLLSQRFDIIATIPENESPRQVPVMLRGLLADRFKLVVHTETREASVLSLTLESRDGRLVLTCAGPLSIVPRPKLRAEQLRLLNQDSWRSANRKSATASKDVDSL